MIFIPFFRSIKIGKMSQTPAHILENLQTALPAVVNAVKGGWDNIQNFTIKTNSSVSLPIWSCTLNITDVRQIEDAEERDEIFEKEEDEEEDEEEKAAKEQASRKGRKRVTNSDGEMEGVEKPRKRSKASDGMMRGVSIPKKEVRQKRSFNIGEKKKRIVLMSKGSKSAMLGKKLGTSQIHP
jgi:ribosome biogenesis protein UTP30